MSSGASPSPEQWDIVGERDGVRLRTTGSGTPVLVFPGMEGSGESCLHLVLPTLAEVPAGAPTVRPVLVDFSAEHSAAFDDLVDTVGGLLDAHIGEGETCSVWGQSFGNLVAATVLERYHVRVDRLVMVSPFQQLPQWKAVIEPPLVRSTPTPLYRVASVPLSRWQFGPDGGNVTHPFFEAIGRMDKSDLARRTAWLRGRRFTRELQALTPERGKVWLGSRDRLIDLRSEVAFFGGDQPERRLDFDMIDGSGHVVLPPAVIDAACRQLAAWFWEASP